MLGTVDSSVEDGHGGLAQALLVTRVGPGKAVAAATAKPADPLTRRPAHRLVEVACGHGHGRSRRGGAVALGGGGSDDRLRRCKPCDLRRRGARQWVTAQRRGGDGVERRARWPRGVRTLRAHVTLSGQAHVGACGPVAPAARLRPLGRGARARGMHAKGEAAL